jgi:hypothetical protein
MACGVELIINMAFKLTSIGTSPLATKQKAPMKKKRRRKRRATRRTTRKKRKLKPTVSNHLCD